MDLSQASILSPPPPPTPPAAGEGNSALSPLNPGELLIALHNIDSAKCDMKSIIKGEVHPPPPRPPFFSGLAIADLGKNLGLELAPSGISQDGDCAPHSPVSELRTASLTPFHPSSSPSFLPNPI